jgi:DNA polymerase V
MKFHPFPDQTRPDQTMKDPANSGQRKTSLPTGFAGSYDEYSGDNLDLNQLLLSTPAATFFMRVEGDGMAGARIEDGDLLVVDRSLTACNDDIVVVVLDGEFLVRRLEMKDQVIRLHRSEAEPPTEIPAGEELYIWGVVASSITRYR